MSDSLRRLAGKIAGLERDVLHLQTAPRAGHTSIEYGGSIDEYDPATGELLSRTGAQHDGTHGAQILSGPVPLPPTQPVVEAALGSLTISWDGRLSADGTPTVQPLDWAAVEIFLAQDRAPVATDLVGAIVSPAGGQKVLTVPAGEWWVSLRTRTVPGRVSSLTIPVVVSVESVASRIDAAIVEAVAGVDETMAELDERLDDAFTVGGNAAALAQEALTAAAAAMVAAQAASTAAASAGSDAQAANAAALAAAGLAGSKGEVTYQASAPTGSRATTANLWIRTSDNKPHTYNGTSWVAVESKVATDAAAAAATANAAAAAAQSTANAAATAAATADSKAVGAAAAASNAQGAADAANSAAGAAQTTASAAATAAADAAGLAGGKADVLIQSTAPAAAMRKATTLWIDTTGGLNAPKRWTTGATWVAVTDKAATDAAAAAAAAQTAAGNAASAAATAQARADAAHTLAGTAITNADAAIASANARNALYRSTAAPSGTATRVGDMWWRFANTSYAQVIGTWMWSGTSWVQSQLAHQVISSVDVGALTVVGTATLAQAVIDFLWANVVAAKKITTDMLLVGSGANLLPDNLLRNKAAWTAPAWVDDVAGVISIPASATQQDVITVGTLSPNYMASVVPGSSVRLTVTARSAIAIAASRIQIVIYFSTATGASAGSAVLTSAPATPANTNVTFSGVLVVPATAVYVRFGVRVVAAHNGQVAFSSPIIQSMTDASLIVDGTVLAQHLAAGSVTGGKISGDAIDGKTITGATFRTGPNVGPVIGGQGVILDSAGLSAFNASGIRTANIESATGKVEFVGGFKTASVGPRIELVHRDEGDYGDLLGFYGGPSGNELQGSMWTSNGRMTIDAYSVRVTASGPAGPPDIGQFSVRADTSASLGVGDSVLAVGADFVHMGGRTPIGSEATGHRLRFGRLTGAFDVRNDGSSAWIPWAATTNRVGPVELATSAEVLAGTDAARAVTPAALASWRDSHFYLAKKTTSQTGIGFPGVQITGLTLSAPRAGRARIQISCTSQSSASDDLVAYEIRLNGAKIKRGTQRANSGGSSTGHLLEMTAITTLAAGGAITVWVEKPVGSGTVEIAASPAEPCTLTLEYV